MSLDSRFTLEQSSWRQVQEIFVIIYDVIATGIISIPLLFKDFLKLFVSRKKDIRGKLALVMILLLLQLVREVKSK